MGRSLVSHPRIVVLVYGVLLLIGLGIASRVEYDISFRPLYQSDDELLEETENFTREFDNVNNMILTVFEGPDAFSFESVTAFSEMTKALEGVRHVELVYSFTNVPFITRTEDGMIAEPLYEGATRAQYPELRQKALAYELYQQRLISPDGKRVAVVVQLDDRYVEATTEAERRPVLAEIDALLASHSPEGFSHHTLGTRTLERDYRTMLEHDQVVFFGLGFVINVLLLFWALRSWGMIAGALAATTACLVVSIAAVERMGLAIDILSSQMIPMVQVIATAQVVHLLYAYYERLRLGESRESAVFEAAASVRMGNLAASVTTAAGFFSLLAASVTSVRSFGLKMGVSVILIFFVVSTLLPALLALLPRPSDAALATVERSTVARRVIALFYAARGRPRLLATCTFALLLPCVYGMSQVRIENFAMGEVRADHPLTIAMHETDKLAGFTGFEISIESRAGTSLIEPENLRNIAELSDFLSEQAGVITSWSLADYLAHMNGALSDRDETSGELAGLPDSRALASQLLLTYSLSSSGSREVEGLINSDRTRARIVGRVHDIGASRYLALRDRVEAHAREIFPPDRYRVAVLGEPLLVFRGLDRIARDLVESFSVAFLLVFGVVFLGCRSLRLGLISILPNVLPIVVTAGIMGLLGIPLRVGTTIFFAMALAVSVDDTVHYLIRYRREVEQGRSASRALELAQFGTGRASLATSVVMGIGFLATLPSEFLTLRDMAVLNFTAISVALVSDLVLLPALLTRFPYRTPAPTAPRPSLGQVAELEESAR